MDVPDTAVKSPLEDLRWEFRKAREFGRFCKIWDEIHNAASGLPLMRASFVAALLKEFGTDRELIAIGYRGNTANAMTLLVRSYTGYTTFQPSQAPLGVWIHRPQNSLEMLVPSLLRKLPGFALEVAVTQQDPDQVRRPVDGGAIETLDYIQTARVTITTTFDEYWAARGKNLRNNTKRQRNRLEKDGVTLRLETIVDPGDVAQAIIDYSRLESAGWKGAEGTAVHPDNAQGRFYRALFEDFCRRGAGIIYRYWYGDSVAAVDLCIKDDDTLIVLKTTYDETIQNSSPASLMRHEYFRQIFDETGIKRIEFYGRVMEWHTKWTSEARTLYHVNFYRWTWLSQIRSKIRERQRSVALDGKGEAGLTAHTTSEAARPRQKYAVAVHEDFAALPDRFKTLFARAGNTSVFLTFQWYLNFIQTALASNERPRIYAVDTTTDPISARAALLVRYSDTGAPGSIQLNGLCNYYTSLFGPVIDPDESDTQAILNVLAAAIAGDKIRWNVIDLRPLAIDTPVFGAMVNAFRNAGMLVQTYFCFGNWYLRVHGRSFAEYLDSLPSKTINTIRKKKEQIEKAFKSKIVVYRDPATLDEALQAYEQVYAASWKEPEPNPEFIRSLCRACAASGWLRLGIIYVDAQPIAAQIWIVHASVASIYKLAYDERFAQLSPGTVLTAHLMNHVIDTDKVREVDFLTGDDAYKKDWMSDRRERWGVIAFNPRTPSGLLAFSQQSIRRSARQLVNFARQFSKTGNFRART
jgi:CelD/BcsL family acetyltransferase involved in cellulose biosynthesis